MLQNNNQKHHVHVLNNMMNCINIKLKDSFTNLLWIAIFLYNHKMEYENIGKLDELSNHF